MLINGFSKLTGKQRPINVTENGELLVASSDSNKSTTTNSIYLQVLNSNDLVKTFNYADIGTVDERVIEIQYSSATLGTGFIEKYEYSGSAGAYRVSSFTRIAQS